MPENTTQQSLCIQLSPKTNNKIVVITVESKGKASVFCLKLHADENNGSIKWKIMSDPYFPRLCSRQGSTFMTRTRNVLYFLHAISMLTARLLPSPLRAIHENLVL